MTDGHPPTGSESSPRQHVVAALETLLVIIGTLAFLLWLGVAFGGLPYREPVGDLMLIAVVAIGFVGVIETIKTRSSSTA